MNKSVVIDEAFDWEGDHLLQTPLHETIIYEAHVKGFTMQHPELDPHVRGTYYGLGSEAVLYHLKKLGVTAIETIAGAPLRARPAPGGIRAWRTTGATIPLATLRLILSIVLRAQWASRWWSLKRW